MSGKTGADHHPCFSESAALHYGRIHLPVAPKCNIQCNYCDRRYDCANENRPGVAAEILQPEEAAKKVGDIIKKEPYIRVVGIAGPGDALFNRETFETFRLIGARFPLLVKCLSTNGLLLSRKISELHALGIETITVTVNAVDAEVGERIICFIRLKGRKLCGREAARILIENQLAGITLAAEAGITVKVNTVFVPSINGHHLPAISKKIAEAGAVVQNIMPLIPLGRLSHLGSPSSDEMAKARSQCAGIIRQITHCRQCRADAVGFIREVGPCREPSRSKKSLNRHASNSDMLYFCRNHVDFPVPLGPNKR